MKNLLYILLLLPALAFSQTISQNYVKTLTYREPVTSTDATKAQVNVTYLDGLGRPIQQIAGKASATGKDIITHIEYDAWGRQVKGYLPFAAPTSTLAFDDNAQANTIDFYGDSAYESTPNPYTQKFLEASPLGRILKQAAPGELWEGHLADNNDHTVKFACLTNNYSTEVKKYTAVATWNAATKVFDIAFGSTGTGYHAIGKLYKNIIQDENKTGDVYIGTSSSATSKQNSVHEFKNQKGHMLLRKRFNINSAGTSETMDTYYIYDQFGNLTYVLPPLMTSTSQIDALGYQYKYDARNRVVEKKLPGKQWEYFVYDSQDRVVATGPVLSPFGGTATIGWIITKYDAFGRVAYTGWHPEATFSSAVRKTMQDNTFAVVTKNTSAVAIDGIQVNYNNSFPTAMKLLTVNYYDNYTFSAGPTPPSTIESQNVATNVKGLATASWIRALTTATETFGELTYTFYDIKGRPIRTKSVNYLGGYTQTDSKLDFDGTILYTITKHKRTNSSTEITTREDFTYTVQDRLLSHSHTNEDHSPQLMSYNTYDELGQLKIKRTGGDDLTGATSLQKIDNSYNVRGWLKSINNVDNLAPTGGPQDLFAFRINYTASPAEDINSKVGPLYNGNIAETSWRTASDNIQRRYGYTYDNTNRLTDAWYQMPNSTVPVRNSYDEHMEYDKNGNIKHLDRNGESDNLTSVIATDNLDYVYDGILKNRLLKVTDITTHPAGFKDFTNTDDDFGYDDFGNMASDKNKGITSVTYNHLNLPTEIVFNSNTNTKINYLYDAAGVKLKKIVKSSSIITVTTDYLDGFQYKDQILEFFPTAEGYVKYTPPLQGGTQGRYNYVYHYKDHLGNIRLSYTVDPADGILKIMEENHYYPFGLKHNGYSATGQNIKGGTPGGTFPTGPTVVLVPVINPGEEDYKYKYNGKELQDELGLNMYDYGARNYDPALGRWMNIDPLAEVSRRFSPYAYALNNPVYFIDPDGMMASTLRDEMTEQMNPSRGLERNRLAEAEAGHQEFLDRVAAEKENKSIEVGPLEGGEPPVSFFGTDDDQVFLDFYTLMTNSYKSGDNIFKAIGHGSKLHVGNRTDDGDDRYLQTAEQFDALMSIRSPEYKKAIEAKKSFTLYLYICRSGTTPINGMSMAAKISLAHPNAIVYGFDGTGHFDYVNGKATFLGIGNHPTNSHLNDNRGYLVAYKNGREVKRIKSNDYVRNLINKGL